jgi:hypothetical protein
MYSVLKLNIAAFGLLRRLLLQDEQLYLEEIRDELEIRTGIQMSLATVCRGLHDLGSPARRWAVRCYCCHCCCRLHSWTQQRNLTCTCCCCGNGALTQALTALPADAQTGGGGMRAQAA